MKTLKTIMIVEFVAVMAGTAWADDFASSGILSTQAGLDEGNFRSITAGLLNASGDGFFDADDIIPAFEAIPSQWFEGDANRDGVVSAGDYASVQANFGNTGEPGIFGDANGDGVVSAGDYASVQANFGAIPEPATLSLLAIGGVAMIKRKKRICCNC